MTRFTNSLKQLEAGQGLVGIMLTMALISIIGLGISYVATSANRQNRIQSLKGTSATIATVIGSVTYNPELCSSFIKKGPDDSGDDPSFRVNALAKDGDTFRGQNLTVCVPSLTEDGTCDPGDSTEWIPQSGNFIKGTQFKVREIVFVATQADVIPGTPTVTTLIGSIQVSLDHVSNSETTSFARRVAIPLAQLVLHDEVVESCTAATSAQAICEGLHGVYDESKIPACTLPLPDMSCGSQEVIDYINADGTPHCKNIQSSCEYGEVVVGLNNGELECDVVGDWDFSDWAPCSGGTTTRKVRCVAAARMHKWMSSGGYTTFQDSVPKEIILANSACVASTKPSSGPVSCASVDCKVPVGTSWIDPSTSLRCMADAELTIPEGTTLVATDSSAPDTGTSSFTCNSGVVTASKPKCIGEPINGVCGTANGKAVALPPIGNAQCLTGTASTILSGTGPWSWTCLGVNEGTDSGICSATLDDCPLGRNSSGQCCEKMTVFVHCPLANPLVMNRSTGQMLCNPCRAWYPNADPDNNCIDPNSNGSTGPKDPVTGQCCGWKGTWDIDRNACTTKRQRIR